MASRRLKLPYVLFFDADDIFELDFSGEPITGLLRWRAKHIIRYTLTAAHCVITVSQATKTRLVNVWFVSPEKIVVFPNAVDVDRHRRYPQESAAIRALLGLHYQPVIIYVGTFQPWHDVSTLLDAFSLVLSEFPTACLVLVGDGKGRPAMMQHATDLGIGHAVRFTGFRPYAEIPILISTADVAVAPYPHMEHTWWGSSMKLFEYLASGVATVASDVGEQVTEVIRDGTNGLLAAPGQAEPMAAALKRLLRDPDLRFQLGQAAREDAIRRYSWEHYLSRLESVYAALLNGQPLTSI